MSFTVVEAVEHGARVKKGDVLVEFDSEKIDKAIADLRTEQQIAEVAIKTGRRSISHLGKKHAHGPGGQPAGVSGLPKKIRKVTSK